MQWKCSKIFLIIIATTGTDSARELKSLLRPALCSGGHSESESVVWDWSVIREQDSSVSQCVVLVITTLPVLTPGPAQPSTGPALSILQLHRYIVIMWEWPPPPLYTGTVTAQRNYPNLYSVGTFTPDTLSHTVVIHLVQIQIFQWLVTLSRLTTHCFTGSMWTSNSSAMSKRIDERGVTATATKVNIITKQSEVENIQYQTEPQCSRRWWKEEMEEIEKYFCFRLKQQLLDFPRGWCQGCLSRISSPQLLFLQQQVESQSLVQV